MSTELAAFLLHQPTATGRRGATAGHELELGLMRRLRGRGVTNQAAGGDADTRRRRHRRTGPRRMLSGLLDLDDQEGGFARMTLRRLRFLWAGDPPPPRGQHSHRAERAGRPRVAWWTTPRRRDRWFVRCQGGAPGRHRADATDTVPVADHPLPDPVLWPREAPTVVLPVPLPCAAVNAAHRGLRPPAGSAWLPSATGPAGHHQPAPVTVHAARVNTLRHDDVHVAQVRDALVDRLLVNGQITSPVVEQAFRTVPRHLSVAEGHHAGGRLQLRQLRGDQTKDADGVIISSTRAAFIQARMIEQAGIGLDMAVLEIGSGGYNAALLAMPGTVASTTCPGPTPSRFASDSDVVVGASPAGRTRWTR